MKIIKKYLAFIFGSELIKNSSILASGTLIAQLIPILIQPFVRRLFPPEAFGAYAVYLSVIGIIVAGSSFKYELAIVIPEKTKESVNVIGLTIFSNIFFSLVFLAIIIFWHNPISHFLNIPEKYSSSIYFIPVGIFLLAVNQNFNLFLIRQKSFINASFNKLSRRGSEGVIQLYTGYKGVTLGLVISDIIGNFINSFVAIYQSVKADFRFQHINYSQLKSVMFKYSEFPKYNFLPSLMSTSSFLLPTIIINKNYSSDMAGFFDLSKLLLSLPLVLISTSLSNVLLQRISENYFKRKSLINDLKPLFYIILAVAIIEVVTVLLFGEFLFKVLFGKEWIISGQISKILVLSYSLNFILSSFNAVFIALRKIKAYSYWQVIYFASIFMLFFFRGISFNHFILIYVIIEILCYFSLAYIMYRVINSYEKAIDY